MSRATCDCGLPATCFGSYEGMPPDFACDECCGHGCEDGCCEMIEEHGGSPERARDAFLSEGPDDEKGGPL